MIKVENVKVYNIARAVYSARNPLNSWAKSDSDLDKDILGPNDIGLAQRLISAGPEHRKFLRQIFVTMDITAPLYWISEFDTYKVGTVRNSCSFMHKGVSKPFEISDFSVSDSKVYEILSPLVKKECDIVYPYETEEYKIYTCDNGRRYRVYKNGRVFAEPFEYTDSYGTGRTRKFELKECKPYKTPFGYYALRIGGRTGEHWRLHRLVATVWINTPDKSYTVNHKDGNKGNNCVENLEWCTIAENTRKGYESGLFDNIGSLHSRYLRWKNGFKITDPRTQTEILFDSRNGLSVKEIADKYNLTNDQAQRIVGAKEVENRESFYMSYIWESIIDGLNNLRCAYLETKDNQIFEDIRRLLPCGYNQRYTVTMNYENVLTMIKQRTGHRLTEWGDFIKVLWELPYAKELFSGVVDGRNDEKSSSKDD